MKKKTGRKKKVRRSDTVVVLDWFTRHQLRSWESHGDTLQWLADRIYFELERQRVAQYDALCASLRAAPAIPVDVTNWARVTDWRWNLTPLSAVGSLNGIGGRFNIGNDLDRARNQAFKSLYLAQDIETAFGEYFGGSLSAKKATLSLGEFALRRASSFTTFLLAGKLEDVLDLRSDRSLGAFADIIKSFDISPETKTAIRKAGLPPRQILRSAQELWARLLRSNRRRPRWRDTHDLG